MYSSGIQKPSCESLALSFNNRTYYREKYLNANDSSFSHYENHLNRVYRNQEKHQCSNSTCSQNSKINIETHQGHEISLDIIPASINEINVVDTDSNSTSIKINIEIPSNNDASNTNKIQYIREQLEPKVSVIYSKKGNIRIAITHNTKFKLKHLNSPRKNNLNKIMQLFKFKRKSIKRKFSNSYPFCQTDLQDMLDEDLLDLNQINNTQFDKKQQSNNNNNKKARFAETFSYNKSKNESELDAYMQELSMRQMRDDE